MDDRLRNIEKDLVYRNNYREWKLKALDEAGYFVIFQGFIEDRILQRISGNALKLYIYLGMHSNNYEGIVWHSNSTISKYFGKSERTIRGWMHELEEENLIKRMRLSYDGNVYTYLQPYSFRGQAYDMTEDNVNGKRTIEGVFYIDQIGGLHIKGENIYIPVTNSMDMKILNPDSNEWEYGTIQIRRLNLDDEELDNNEIDYIEIIFLFKCMESKQIIRIDNNKNLRVRVIIE